MKEVLRTNDPVLISLARSLLKEAGIETLVFDGHTAILEGSIGAIQARLMVIARWTWPVWMYVSITGVLVYFFLYVWFPKT